ncbi:hypothetical protein ACTHPH_11130 [Paenibacillus pasadenensis]|uniref:Uncharacterized protein n=1 Tax=Paenibacillus pasadenensis TaxID=217090 RepID=A0A2N5N4U0_9BACL|nr:MULTISPECIES: hypothetical protein [Paenibacillus]PLT45333.1 hypothetical protein B8V81_3764 [Paenibacillus pasadenensis]QGG55726.1 hypothetical protein GE073_09190 [Paenibacillus sp. B01]
MRDRFFVPDARLGIDLPRLDRNWDQYDAAEQMGIVEQWELIRGRIPDVIFALERQIVLLQRELDEEEDFARSCRLNSDIAELASRINDLHIWYRVNQEIEARRHS